MQFLCIGLCRIFVEKSEGDEDKNKNAREAEATL